MRKPSKLVFFGTENFSARSLQALIDSSWPVAAVVTKPDARSGRGQKISSSKVKEIALQSQIKVLQPYRLSDIKNELEALAPTHGVLVAYGKIVPRGIIDVFPGGIINLHPSKLPKYRGPSPIEAAILYGDKETAVSLMKLTEGMDEGPVYAQKTVPLKGDEDRLSLSSTLADIGADFLIENLPEIVEGRLRPQPQNNTSATYTSLLKKEDGLTDWGEPAEVLERKVRAFRGFPKLKGKVFGHEVVVNRARVAKNSADGSLVIACRPGCLEIIELIAPSGRAMSGGDFIRGYYKP